MDYETEAMVVNFMIGLIISIVVGCLLVGYVASSHAKDCADKGGTYRNKVCFKGELVE